MRIYIEKVEFIFGFFLFEIPYSSDLNNCFYGILSWSQDKLFWKKRDKGVEEDFSLLQALASGV